MSINMHISTLQEMVKDLKHLKWHANMEGFCRASHNIAITHHPCSIVYCTYLLKYRIAAG